jgi:hypothetical protein
MKTTNVKISQKTINLRNLIFKIFFFFRPSSYILLDTIHIILSYYLHIYVIRLIILYCLYSTHTCARGDAIYTYTSTYINNNNNNIIIIIMKTSYYIILLLLLYTAGVCETRKRTLFAIIVHFTWPVSVDNVGGGGREESVTLLHPYNAVAVCARECVSQ